MVPWTDPCSSCLRACFSGVGWWTWIWSFLRNWRRRWLVPAGIRGAVRSLVSRRSPLLAQCKRQQYADHECDRDQQLLQQSWIHQQYSLREPIVSERCDGGPAARIRKFAVGGSEHGSSLRRELAECPCSW